jgi:hypothetical protein
MDRNHQLSADATTSAVPPARIACLDPPYAPDVAALLFGITARTSSREPLKLFRLIARDRDRTTLSFVDELHDTGHVSDPTWPEMSARFSDGTLIELLVLVGWYHAIAYLANGTRTERESWALRFPENVRPAEGER